MHDYLKEMEKRERVENLKRDIKIFMLPTLIIACGLLLYYFIFYAFHANIDSSSVASSEPEKRVESSAQTSTKSSMQSKESKTESSISSSTSSVEESLAEVESSSSIDEAQDIKQEKEILDTPREQQDVVAEEEVSSSSVSSVDKEVLKYQKESASMGNIESEDFIEEKSISTESKKEIQSSKQSSKQAYMACYRVDAPILNVRSEPTIDQNIVGQVNSGDIVCAYEEFEGWIRTDLGWIYANRLEEVAKP